MKKTAWTYLLGAVLAISSISSAGTVFILLTEDQWEAQVLAGCVGIYFMATATAAFALFVGKAWAPNALVVWGISFFIAILPMQFWVVGASFMGAALFTSLFLLFIYKVYRYVDGLTLAH